ncbi:GGDEF domain-containing protein [Alkalihalobacterium elongatum]|uniref:GGDEF domain-containing protein n=1 Tax=Alkalihalobacterium elongatum TaxID=2675466 RepID=UPI001C1F523D|nr:diguanylate cyclase [Alkalihalobacterium elongatum]
MHQSILSNLAIVLLMHLMMSTIMNYRDRLNKRLVSVSIIVIFSGAVISMFYLPIEFGEYKLDLRLIPLVFLALLKGWKTTIPVLIIVSAWRFFMGGDGAVPGIVFGMVGPTLLALAFFNKNNIHTMLLHKFVIVTFCWFISDFPIIFIIPDGLELFKSIYLIRYGSFIGAAFILYSLTILEYKREVLKQRLEFLATHDQLTKLLNKKRFFNVVEKKINVTRGNCYIAMIDIDHFKRLNDTYGHLTGDYILVKLSEILRKFENDKMTVARYGGEEFIIYIDEDHIHHVVEILETIQNEIRKTKFSLDGISLSITVSIGLARLEDSQLQTAVKAADEKLYKAKKNGRDQLVS